MGILQEIKPRAGDPAYSEHISTPAAAFEGELYVVNPIAVPNNPALAGSGAVPAGTYNYKYTYAIVDPVSRTVIAETLASPAAATPITIGTSSQISVGGITTSVNTQVNARRIYRSTNGGVYEQIATIYDNTSTSFTDNTVSSANMPVEPIENSTGQSLILNVPNVAEALVIKEAGASKLQIASDGVPRLGQIKGLIHRTTTSFEVLSTISETTLYSTTVTGGIMGDDGGFILDMAGTMLKNASGTITLRVKLGTVTAFVATNVAGITNDTIRRSWSMRVTCLNVNSASSQKWAATYTSRLNSGSDTLFIAEGSTSFTSIGSGFVNTAVNTETDQTLVVTIQPSASTPSLAYRMEMATLELIPPQ